LFFASLFAAIAAVPLLRDGPRVMAMPQPLACAGCASQPLQDPRTGMRDGVRVVFTAPGFNPTDADLNHESGACDPSSCLPAANCKFSGSITMSGISQFFTPDVYPCEWSSLQPPGTQQISTVTNTWYGACSDDENIMNMSFYVGTPPNCESGELVGWVQWGSKCTACRG